MPFKEVVMISYYDIFLRYKKIYVVSVYIKKRSGLSRVSPGRPGSGSIGFRRANSSAGFYLDPDRSQARVDPLGRSEFQNYDQNPTRGDNEQTRLP